MIIAFATHKEAGPTIEALKAVLSTQFPYCWEFSGGIILVTGMGALSSAIALAQILPHFPYEIVNWGIAGSLKDNYNVGQIIEIGTVCKFHGAPHLDTHCLSLFDKCHPPIPCSSKKKERLITSDFPLYDATTRHRLAQIADLVDMEGYGIAAVAERFNRPCRLFKVISDFAKPGHADWISRHIDQLSCQIAEHFANNSSFSL